MPRRGYAPGIECGFLRANTLRPYNLTISNAAAWGRSEKPVPLTAPGNEKGWKMRSSTPRHRKCNCSTLSVAEHSAALGAAAREDLTATFGGHTGTEAVHLLTMALLGLIGTFGSHSLHLHHRAPPRSGSASFFLLRPGRALLSGTASCCQSAEYPHGYHIRNRYYNR